MISFLGSGVDPKLGGKDLELHRFSLPLYLLQSFNNIAVIIKTIGQPIIDSFILGNVFLWHCFTRR